MVTKTSHFFSPKTDRIGLDRTHKPVWLLFIFGKILKILPKIRKNTKKQEGIIRVLVKKSFQTSNICVGKF
jgi:hypothetical protein